MFTGLNEGICAVAWEIVKPSIKSAANIGVTNKLAGYVVVLNPHNGKALFTGSIGGESPKSAKYLELAQAKARVCRETGLPSREVQQNAPHLYRPGMTKWGGGVIENNLVVAFSGVQAIFDEAIASTMLRWIVALCQNEMTRDAGVMSSESSYIEEPRMDPVR